MLLVCAIPAGASVVFNSGNFWDETFRQYLKDEYSFVDNATLTDTQLANVTEIYINSMGKYGKNKIKNLKGIEFFPNLKKIDMSFQEEIESIDLTYNKNLEYVNLFGLARGSSKLKTIKAEGLTKLKYLNLSQNSLENLNITGDTALETLRCYGNYLKTLDISTNGKLIELACYNNLINQETLNTSANASLKILSCYGNSIKNLKLQNNPYLKMAITGNSDPNLSDRYSYYSDVSEPGLGLYELTVDKTVSITLNAPGDTPINKLTFPDDEFRKYVRTFETSGDNIFSSSEKATVKNMNCSIKGIASLTGIQNFTELENLNCSDNNGLTTLNLTMNTKLKTLNCSSCNLSSLNVNSCTNLQSLDCHYNTSLDTLNIAALSKLKELNVRSCNFGSLNVSNNTALTTLDCSYNYLTSLNVSSNTNLTTLLVGVNNPLSTLDVSKNTLLAHLECGRTGISKLDIRNCPKLIDAFENGTKTDDSTFNILTFKTAGDAAILQYNKAATLETGKDYSETEGTEGSGGGSSSGGSSSEGGSGGGSSSGGSSSGGSSGGSSGSGETTPGSGSEPSDGTDPAAPTDGSDSGSGSGTASDTEGTTPATEAAEKTPAVTVQLEKAAVTPKNTVASSTVKKAIKNSTNDKTELVGATFSQLMVKGVAKSKKSIRLSWKKIKGANKYLIYAAKCGNKNKLKKIATTNKLTYKYTKCSAGKYYKFMVLALNGRKVLAISPKVHVASKGGKYGNATGVKLNKKTISLERKKKVTLKAALVKTLPVKKHRSTVVKFESGNVKVATVSDKGVVKAVGKGACYIYAYAQNGVYARAKVVVTN